MQICLACGACCAAFRVSFHYTECQQEGGCVPDGLAELETATIRRMRGTDHSPPRCTALIGTIGKAVHCGIYEFRPSPCRDFVPHGQFGLLNAACNHARRRHGLAPLPDPPALI